VSGNGNSVLAFWDPPKKLADSLSKQVNTGMSE